MSHGILLPSKKKHVKGAQTPGILEQPRKDELCRIYEQSPRTNGDRYLGRSRGSAGVPWFWFTVGITEHLRLWIY
jgi:hypothetical protein